MNWVYGYNGVSTTPFKVASDSTNNNLIIPLEFNMTLHLTSSQRVQLYQDCCLLVLNALVVSALAWYQEGWFEIVITVVTFIIGAIIMIVSEGAFAVEVAAMFTSVQAFLSFVAYRILLTLILYYAATWLMTVVEPEIAVYIAISAAIASLILGGTDSNLTIPDTFTLNFAQIALQTASAIISAADEFITKALTLAEDSYDTLVDLIDAAEKEMATNQEVIALTLKADFDTTVLRQSKHYYTVCNEYPAAFFQRTLGLCENSLYGIHQAIPNFAHNLLLADRNLYSRGYSY
jgi:hypothetical protein